MTAKSSPILSWRERCNRHPDHRKGIVTSDMIRRRMQEEIDELRKVVDQLEQYLCE